VLDVAAFRQCGSVFSDWGKPTMSQQKSDREEPSSALSRRKALAKLGLATGAVYMAPVVLKINRSKAVIMIPTPCFQANNNPADNPPDPTCPP
jgi:hypothetical protein